MAQTKGPELRPAEIGAKARMIRKRRGMSLAVAAGLAGISKSYLSQLENGVRRFDKRSTIAAVAEALGCSVIDLTGEPYVPVDRRAAEALTAIPAIQLAIYDCALDDAPDMPARPLSELAELVHSANAARDQADHDVAGRDMGQVLTELQVIAATQTAQERQDALTLFVEAAYVAYAVATAVGHTDLAVGTARRGYDAAKQLDDAALIGFATWGRALALQRIGARHRVTSVLANAIETLEPVADPSASDTAAAEAYGMLHFTAGLDAARLGHADTARNHLNEATRIAERTGERNAFYAHFGPTNAAVWRVTIGVELGEGAGAYERAMNANIDPERLNSPGRLAGLHLDLARVLAQEGGSRDWDAIRHLDKADRIASIRTRHDPIARELLAELDNRARIRAWELESLRHRFGWN